LHQFSSSLKLTTTPRSKNFAILYMATLIGFAVRRWGAKYFQRLLLRLRLDAFSLALTAPWSSAAVTTRLSGFGIVDPELVCIRSMITPTRSTALCGILVATALPVAALTKQSKCGMRAPCCCCSTIPLIWVLWILLLFIPGMYEHYEWVSFYHWLVYSGNFLLSGSSDSTVKVFYVACNISHELWFADALT
jgi:hypothetical protein